MAAASLSGGRAPARTLAALANIPPPTSKSDVAHLVASIHNVGQLYASVVEQHRGVLRKQLELPPPGAPRLNPLDRMALRRAARIATAPLAQCAERARGAGASAVACWHRYLREFGEPAAAPKGGTRTFDHRK